MAAVSAQACSEDMALRQKQSGEALNHPRSTSVFFFFFLRNDGCYVINLFPPGNNGSRIIHLHKHQGAPVGPEHISGSG